jgi:hypothetical protein
MKTGQPRLDLDYALYLNQRKFDISFIVVNKIYMWPTLYVFTQRPVDQLLDCWNVIAAKMSCSVPNYENGPEILKSGPNPDQN